MYGLKNLRENYPLQIESRRGRNNPEPGTGVPGNKTEGSQVPFRGRHNRPRMFSANQSRRERVS